MSPASAPFARIEFTGIHHVGILVASLEESMQFYQGLLGELSPPFTRGALFEPLTRESRTHHSPPPRLPSCRPGAEPG